jgi:protein-S-isoprenylcysteine O-methyltransferase Ste14
MQDALFTAAVVGYLGVAFAWPTLRVWQRHGVWPIVFEREAAPGQRLLGLLTALLLVGLAALGPLRLGLGAPALGIGSLPAAVGLAGWLLLLGGTALTVMAQGQMGASWRVGIDDRPTALVNGGPFRLVRNPIFTGLLAFLAGVVLLAPAWWSVAAWLATFLGLRRQVHYEEQHLASRHGVAYLDYAAHVGRFVPRIGRLRPSARPAADEARS